MRSAHGGHGPFPQPNSGADGPSLVGGIFQQPETLGLVANNAAPDLAAPRRSDDARNRHPAGDDSEIDGEFIAAGKELTRSVEGIHDQEASIKMIMVLVRGFLRDNRYAGQKSANALGDQHFGSLIG